VGLSPHRLTIPAARAAVTMRRLGLAIPGVRTTIVEDRSVDVHRALRLKLSSHRRALRTDRLADVSLGLLRVLAGTHRDELLMLQWTLGPRLRAVAIPNQFVSFRRESWLGSGLSAPFGGPRPVIPSCGLPSEISSRWQAGGPSGRIAVRAGSDRRERQLLHELLAALRVAEAPGLKLEARPIPVRQISEQRTPRWHWPMVINEAEIVGLAAWPIGDVALPGLSAARTP